MIVGSYNSKNYIYKYFISDMTHSTCQKRKYWKSSQHLHWGRILPWRNNLTGSSIIFMPEDSGLNGTGTCLMRRFSVLCFGNDLNWDLDQGFSATQDRRQAWTAKFESVHARKGATIKHSKDEVSLKSNFPKTKTSKNFKILHSKITK